MSHPVNKRLAAKGKAREDKYRKRYEADSWKIEKSHLVNANGVDLVCYKKAESPDEFCVAEDPDSDIVTCYPERVLIFEITNWEWNTELRYQKAMRYIHNLEEEEKRQRKLHPKADIWKILVVSYWKNVEYQFGLLMKNGVYVEVVGSVEPYEYKEEKIEGWVN